MCVAVCVAVCCTAWGTLRIWRTNWATVSADALPRDNKPVLPAGVSESERQRGGEKRRGGERGAERENAHGALEKFERMRCQKIEIERVR